MTSKLWQFSSMNTKDLCAEFFSHIFYHFFCSFILKHLLIHCDGVETLERQSKNTVLTVFNSALAINMSFEVLLKFLLVFEAASFPDVNHNALGVDSWLVDPNN
jgi:hypothetical protein